MSSFSTSNAYEQMLEKYRDINEDEILSSLTAEELERLDVEIDREVLNKAPKPCSDEESPTYVSSSDDESFSSTSSEPPKRITDHHIQSDRAPKQPLEHPSKERLKHVDGVYLKKKSKSGHQFKVPILRKAKFEEREKRRKSEEGGELKKELLQAVKQRTKCEKFKEVRRSAKKNSKKHSSKCANKMGFNKQFVTPQILLQRPKLKKVQTREPAKVNEMLHGISLSHVTSNAKDQAKKEEVRYPSSSSCAEGKFTLGSDSDDELTVTDSKMFRSSGTPREIGDAWDDDTTSSSTTVSSSADSYDVIGELSINSNSVEETLLRIWQNDPELTEVNLNNIQNVNMEVFEELASALEGNRHVKHLSLANVGLTDKPAKAMATMLKRNHSLEILNVESNFITGEAALKLVSSLRRNQSLTDLRLDNQRHIFGAKVEQEFSKVLKHNKTLLKFGYQFANPGFRMSTSNILTRNMDEVRKKRVMVQKRRSQADMKANQYQRRQQTSSSWYRKEKAKELQKMKDQEISLDERGVVKDEDVQKVLDQISPFQFDLLEEWFLNRLLGQVEKPGDKNSSKTNNKSKNSLMVTGKKSISSKADAELLERPLTPTPPRNEDDYVINDDDVIDNEDSCESSNDNYEAVVKTSANKSDHCKKVVHNRDSTRFDDDDDGDDVKDDVINDDGVTNDDDDDDDDDNIRYNQNDNKLNDRNCTWRKIDKSTVNYEKIDDGSESNNDVTDCEMDKSFAEEDFYDKRNRYTAGSNIKDFDFEVQSVSGSSDDVISWKEGAEYDSNEYEVVEVEVTDAEESALEEEQDDPHQIEQQSSKRFRSESTICLKKT